VTSPNVPSATVSVVVTPSPELENLMRACGWTPPRPAPGSTTSEKNQRRAELEKAATLGELAGFRQALDILNGHLNPLVNEALKEQLRRVRQQIVNARDALSSNMLEVSVCTCGHLRLNHGHSESRSNACSEPGCGCGRFRPDVLHNLT